MSQSEGASTEGNLYDSWHHILILDPNIISWPSGDQDLQWHGQLIALLSESVTTSPSGRGLVSSRWGSSSSGTVVGRHPCSLVGCDSSFGSTHSATSDRPEHGSWITLWVTPPAEGSMASTPSPARHRLYGTPFSIGAIFIYLFYYSFFFLLDTVGTLLPGSTCERGLSGTPLKQT